MHKFNYSSYNETGNGNNTKFANMKIVNKLDIRTNNYLLSRVQI